MIPLYASVNDVLSLCMIMAVIALLVGRSQSFASLHFVVRENTSHASNFQKPKFSNVSTISTYWQFVIPSTFVLLLSILQIKLFMLCEN
jgi:hypothetical protein